MKQGELAQKMNERGHTWKQNTVSMIETGDRTLKLFEAVDLAAALGVTLDELMSSDSAALASAEERAAVAAAQTKLRAAFYTAVAGAGELLTARAELAGVLEDIKTTGTGDPGIQFEVMLTAADFNFWAVLVEAAARAGETGTLPGISRKNLESEQGRKELQQAINKFMGVDLYERPLT